MIPRFYYCFGGVDKVTVLSHAALPVRIPHKDKIYRESLLGDLALLHDAPELGHRCLAQVHCIRVYM